MSTHVQTDGKNSRISSDTEPWDTGLGSVRPFRALRQPVQVAGCRRAFFYHLKGVEKYESEIYLSRLWDPLWAMTDCAGNASVSKSEKLHWPGRRNRLLQSRKT